MRVFGDLNEDPAPNDPSGSRAAGMNGDLKEKDPSHATGEEPAAEDEQVVEAREHRGLGAQEPQRGKGSDYVGGIPSADPPTHRRDGRRYADRASDPISEQRLDAAGDPSSGAYISHRRSTGGLWFVLMVLSLALLGASAYGYLVLRNNHIRVAQVPELLRSITSLGGRVDATEAKLRDLAANADGLTSHLAELDHKIDSSLRATRNQTREMVSQAAGHLQAELDQRGEAVDARLRNVESTQKQDQAQLAQLNEQLRGQVASLREQLAAAQQSTGRDLANVQEQVSNNQGDLRTLAQNLHRDKMTFELVKNSPTELAPGVTLTILKTDVSYQRFNGYITLTNEGKTLWLKNLNAKEAVDLYSPQYDHPYSLIVTAVNEDGVAGYLLLPAGA